MVPVALLALCCAADPALKLDPAQPYTAARGDAVTYTVEFKAIVTAPMNTKVATPQTAFHLTAV